MIMLHVGSQNKNAIQSSGNVDFLVGWGGGVGFPDRVIHLGCWGEGRGGASSPMDYLRETESDCVLVVEERWSSFQSELSHE